ncbi:MAG: 3-hydroxyacyl-CoA dehydrogenase [Gammaproteobacteria bacterium]|nr:3-hydroxyacyl-CoA dehydrogenase [Gammaproteobacteria bacterium]
MKIRKAAVIGAGVMGSGIAAQIANAGIPVWLMDIIPKGAGNRNVLAEAALASLHTSRPAAFMHRRNARLVTPGNIEDHLQQIGDCDWIVEAVVEQLAVKRDLYRQLQMCGAAGAIISSNTSSIPLQALTEDMPEAFVRRFLITHFFNPPRYMRLLEIVHGPATNPEAVAAIREFADRLLGKGVVECKDTPGFIANRIGVFWIQVAIREAIDGRLTVEEADAVIGPPIGIPKTGVFGLSDLVGLDIMPHLIASLTRTLPVDDPLRNMADLPPVIGTMIKAGQTGRKANGGFYRLNRHAGEVAKEAIDLVSGEYRPLAKVELESVAAARHGGLTALFAHSDKGGRYAWRVMSRVLCYAAQLAPAIADDVSAIDRAMQLGYGWKLGPFALIDQLGGGPLVARLDREAIPVPPLLRQAGKCPFYRTIGTKGQYLGFDGHYRDRERTEGVLLLADVKRGNEPLARNPSASLWDIGDGVVCLEFHSKMNSLDPDILSMIREAVVLVPLGYRALVLYNEGGNYSVGANLGLLLAAAEEGGWEAIEALIAEGQQTFLAMKYAPFPVVGAPIGMALGGGCETLLHCDALQAHAETYMGLVEAGVGLIPAWGGCKEMLVRWIGSTSRPGGPMPGVTRCFELISMAAVTQSAAEAGDYLMLRSGDGITMNSDRLLADAKHRALAMAVDYVPPVFPEISLPGPSARVALELAIGRFRRAGKATHHDQVVALALAEVLSGGNTDITETLSEQHLLDLERRVFMGLIRHPGTLARLQHMLKTGKPLRN